MRSLTKKLKSRLAAQAREAETQGLTKVASHLNSTLDRCPARENDASYTYASEDLSHDVESNLWNSVVRTLDYYDTHLDAAEMQHVVEKISHLLIDEIRVKAGISHGVGAYEPNVPGEKLETVTIEVDDE